ncbi:helix-turn-helix domain-containing protein, partial [Eubacterium aggregans]|uniref:helix-turn-helix domain-containing protein n=1 Tax=Eubacterium aggregans TaxID=81409 RepID=UPI003F315102
MRIDKSKFQIALGKAGLNQTEFSEKISMSRGNLSTIINGKSCQPKTAAKIANGLGMDLLEIIK